MVQYFGESKPAGNYITEALGLGAEGLGRVAGEKYRYNQNRGRLQQALEGFKNVANNQNASPADIAIGLMEATAGIPGAEKYVGQILPLLLQRKAAEGSPNIPSLTGGGAIPAAAGGQAIQGVPGQKINQPTRQQPSLQPGQAPSPLETGEQPLSLGNYLPYDLAGQITPEQRADILRKVNIAGGDVAFARQQIDDYNTGKIGQVDLSNQNVDKAAAQTSRQLTMESNVKDFIDNQVANTTPESDKNVLYSMMQKKLPKFGDLTSAYQHVAKDFANFQKTRNSFIARIPNADVYGIPEVAESILRKSGKSLLDTDPLAYNILEEAYVNKGHSIVTPASIHNPLPADIENVMKSAGDYRDYIYPKSFGREISDKEMMRNIDTALSNQEKEIPQMVNRLSKNWNDSVSLINIYTDLKKKGWFPERIYDLFGELKDNVEFSNQQYREMSQLITPPRIPVNILLR